MSAAGTFRAFLAAITPILEKLWKAGVDRDAVIAALHATLLATRKANDAEIAAKRRPR